MLASLGAWAGLDVVRRFLQEAVPHLTAEGSIALEVGHDQGQPIADHATAHGWLHAATKPDLAGIHRFFFAQVPPAPPPTATLPECSAVSLTEP